jgi:rhodanese-related sulfurtransferase
MSDALFPLVFASEELRLLTGVVIGFLFGFSLERAGFGNARKLVGQFYLYDMTVFKVMFTAVLVAMVGLYALAAFGMVDLSRLWVNPTIVWAQLVGGFLIGVGFIMSGLCPGTSVVSAASGRWDGLVTFGGIFLGSLLFALVIDWIPGLAVLYEGGSMGTSVLPELLGVPATWFALGVVVFAGLAFIGAEKVEKLFQLKHEPTELTPKPTVRTPRYKFALAGGLALVALVATGAASPRVEQPDVAVIAMEPLTLAEAIIAGRPDLVILDVREDHGESASSSIPGALRVDSDSAAMSMLASQPPATLVVIYDARGIRRAIPGSWPEGPEYRYLENGFEGWQREVLTPAEAGSSDLAERAAVERQNQISAFFTGAAVRPSTVAAPPPAQVGPRKKKKSMGC